MQPKVTESRLTGTDGLTLHFLTGLRPPGLPLKQAARDLFGAIARALSSSGVSPIQEKIWGCGSDREQILLIRREIYESAGLDPSAPPPTFHMGKPSEADDLTGVQVMGVSPGGSGAKVRPVPGGCLWQGADYRVLCLPGITGPSAGGRPIEALGMLRSAQAALNAHGMDFRRVVRTWIYLGRILDWYGEFNLARNAFFEEAGVGKDPGRSFPASTGIQGSTGSEECSMDLLAADGPGASAFPIRKSGRQGSAADYGSSFSRAASLSVAGIEIVLISGTASIDAAGASLHHGNAVAQISETMDCIRDILEARGAGFRDVRLATVFCKTPQVRQGFVESVARGESPSFPFVPVVADVCRDELLVEIEALAAIPAGGPGQE